MKWLVLQHTLEGPQVLMVADAKDDFALKSLPEQDILSILEMMTGETDLITHGRGQMTNNANDSFYRQPSVTAKSLEQTLNKHELSKPTIKKKIEEIYRNHIMKKMKE